MGETIRIYNTDITLPDVPPHNEIEDWGTPKEEQYWRKKPLPSIFRTLVKDADGNIELTREQEAFAAKEFDRIKNGFWFYNNGKPTYITGRHYYYLQYWTLENRKPPEYRETSRNYFLYLEHWYNVYWCLGIIRGKSRRSGASSESSSNIVCHVTTNKNARGGHVSKTSADARKMFIYRMQFGFRHLPFFLQPTLANDRDSKTELVFNVPISKSKKVKKAQLIDEVEGLNSILDYQPTAVNSYDSERLSWFFGDECFAKDTKILCDNFEFKNIQDIKAGDWVIVEGGKKVQVYSTCNGYDEMFLVKQPYSKDYIVNSKHRLYLEQRNDKFEKSKNNKHKNGIKKITVHDYFNLDKYSKKTIYGVRSNGLQFDKKDTLIEPYILGCWIGDGFTNDCRFIVNIKEDIEILNAIEEYASKNNFRIKFSKSSSKKCLIVSISNSNNRWKKNDFTEHLKKLGILNDKRIPKEYLLNDIETRLELLAGILDTDGCLTKNGVFEICMSRLSLINDISLLAKSCGLSVGNIKKRKTNQNTEAYRITISGDINIIPTKVQRKKTIGYKKQYAYRRNRIEINPIGIDKYYGLTLKTENDDDRRLILGDFTISMNCGKYPADVPVSQFISIILETLVEGAEKVGFCELPSTVNELTKKGGAEFKKVWDEADWIKNDDDGEDESFDENNEATANRLVRYFCPAYDGLSGFIGKYGESIIDSPTEEQSKYLIKKYGQAKFDGQLKFGAKQYLERRRKKLKGATLEEEIRKYPFDEQEMFMAANTECVFNIYNITKREEALKNNKVYKRSVVFFRDMEQKVRWRDVTENEKSFHWKITWFPPEKESNKFITDGKMRKPARIQDGAIAVDSYSNSQGGRKYGSKASAWIGRRYDMSDPQNTGKAIGHLYGRPAVKDTLHEQVMLAAEYYGYQIWYEHTADDYEGYFRERGKLHYLGKYPLGLIPVEKRANADRHRGTPITPFSLTRQLDNGIAYFEYYCDKIDFEEVLETAKVFDPYQRTEYDCIVAFLILISVLMETTPISQRPKESIVKVYDGSSTTMSF
jgi:hypothetical protein